ncbi:MAG: glycosyltransferase family 4 protein [Nitrospinae bacterium]|nr:glycosyltransferase family 4 protein [Nitrospinota bacterium]
MKIGIDCRSLRDSQTSGINTYLKNMVRILGERDTENEYILYCHKDFDFTLPNQRWSKKTGAITQFGNLWLHLELPFWLQKDRIDLFWGALQLLPISLPSNIKGVITLYDLVPFIYPETMSNKNLLANKMFLSASLKKARGINTISASTLRDLQERFNLEDKLVKVTHLGVSDNIRPQNLITAQKRVKELYSISKPYILTVGTLEPRKNVLGTLKAFEQVADKIPHHLVIAGGSGWKNSTIAQSIKESSFNERIHLVGYVEDADLADVYSAASLFIFPSFHEGFGIPPLEAMACGVPVVASNSSSLPEILGDAAVLVDPHNTESISEGIMKILEDPTAPEEYKEKGRLKASAYRWEKTADELLSLFNECSSIN